MSIGDLGPGESALRYFAVTVDSNPPSGSIVNLIRISDDEGNGDEERIRVGSTPPAPAPALDRLGLVVALMMLLAVAGVALRRRPCER